MPRQPSPGPGQPLGALPQDRASRAEPQTQRLELGWGTTDPQRLTHHTGAPPHQAPCPLGPVSLLLCSPAWGKSWTRISVKGSMQPSPMKGTHIGEPKVLLPAAKPGVAWKAEGRPGAGRTQHKGAGRVKEDSDLWGLSWGRDGTRNRAAGGRLGSKCPVAIAIHSAKWL